MSRERFNTNEEFPDGFTTLEKIRKDALANSGLSPEEVNIQVAIIGKEMAKRALELYKKGRFSILEDEAERTRRDALASGKSPKQANDAATKLINDIQRANDNLAA